MVEVPNSFSMIFDVSPEGMGAFINHGLMPVLSYLQSIGIDVSEDNLRDTYLREVGYQVFDYRHFNGDMELFLQTLSTIPNVNNFIHLNKCPQNIVNQFTNSIRYFGYFQFMSLQASGAFNVAIQYGRTMVFDSISMHHISILYGD